MSYKIQRSRMEMEMKYFSMFLLILSSFAFAADPVSDGLIIHLEADSLSGLTDGQTVAAWTDSAVSDSVDGSVATAGYGSPVYVSSSINNLPAVRFIRSEEDSLVSGTWNLPDPSAGLTVFIVCTGGGDGAGVERAVQIGSAAGTASKMIAVDTSTSSSGSGCRYNNGYALATGSNNPLTAGQYHIGVRQMAQNGGHGSLFYAVNGLEAESVSANNPGNTIVFDAAGNHISIGNGMAPGSTWYPDYYDGYIAEILVYNKQLSMAEMNQTGTYLSQKYALAFTSAAIAVETSGDMNVTEDGHPASFNISITSDPGNAPVEITISDYLSPDQVEITPAVVTFNSSNWQNAVEITVSAIDDVFFERPTHDTRLSFAVAASDTSPYYGISLNDIEVYIEDNDCGSHGFSYADVNLDCVVDMRDFAFFALEWIECSNPDPDCQF